MAKRKKPKGTAIRWSKMKPKSGDDIFLEMATPDEETIEAAKQAAPPELKRLLEAAEKETDAEKNQ